jgi:hypothetical protein
LAFCSGSGKNLSKTFMPIPKISMIGNIMCPYAL